MDPLESYYAGVLDTLEQIRRSETEKIREAGGLIGDSLAKGGLLHVFGTGGHSYIAGEEVFYRAGGLVPVNAILDPGVSLACGAVRSTKVERTPGWVKGVLDTYALASGEVLVVVNANGGVARATIQTDAHRAPEEIPIAQGGLHPCPEEIDAFLRSIETGSCQFPLCTAAEAIKDVETFEAIDRSLMTGTRVRIRS